MDAPAQRTGREGALMARILNAPPGSLAAPDYLTPRERVAFEKAPRKPGTRVQVKAYPVKVMGIPAFGAHHQFTEYDDGQEGYIYRGGPSIHGLHAQVTPAQESPDYGRGERVLFETFLPDVPAREAIKPAQRTAARIEASGAPYGVFNSNSNSAVGDQTEAQFGRRVGDARTPGWSRPPLDMPPWLRRAFYSMGEWTGESVRP
jgi:hypothetical protein